MLCAAHTNCLFFLQKCLHNGTGSDRRTARNPFDGQRTGPPCNPTAALSLKILFCLLEITHVRSVVAHGSAAQRAGANKIFPEILFHM